MPERDNERDRGDDRRRHHGNIHERLEILKRAPLDDAREFLLTILDLAFERGRSCGREDECECIEEIMRAEHCCERRERDREWDDDRDRGDRDRRRRD
ncbi:MAG TPA: hypothetical protein VHT52_17940 [Stellaceae bacterium]|jgi:hypothetical protein|nr:hypothetical protein [Stellaceae bacterium]